MALDILSSVTGVAPRLTPVAPRYAALFCFGLLAVVCALSSLAFACATPFAAFAVVAAAMLPLRPALLVVVGAWLVNQAIGFGVLGYPTDGHTALWGIAIGAAALLATAASALALRMLSRADGPLALGIAVIAAFAAYEAVLLAATPILGGAEAFTMAIVARLGVLSVVWLIGLVTACDVLDVLTAERRQKLPS